MDDLCGAGSSTHNMQMDSSVLRAKGFLFFKKLIRPTVEENYNRRKLKSEKLKYVVQPVCVSWILL